MAEAPRRWSRWLTRSLLVVAPALVLTWLLWDQVRFVFCARQLRLALQTQDCELASDLLDKLLAIRPSALQLHRDAARCAWREGRFDKAVEHLETARKLGLPPVELNSEWLLLQSQGELNPIVEARLRTLIDSPPASDDPSWPWVAREALLRAYSQAGRTDDALALAAELAKLFPDHWRVHRLAGEVLEKVDHRLACRAYEKSLEHKADQPKLHFWLALFYARQAVPLKALDHLKSSKRRPDSDPEAAFIAAWANYQLGNWDQARGTLELVLSRGKPQPSALALRGLLELEEHGPEAARDWVAKAEAMAPYDRLVLDAAARLAARLGDQARIAAVNQRQHEQREAIALMPQLQKSMIELNRQANPDRTARQALALRLGETLLRIGDDATAVQWFQSILADDPKHGAAHQRLAEYYQRVGDHEAAARHREAGGLRQDKQ